jgi:hypothetical protein
MYEKVDEKFYENPWRICKLVIVRPALLNCKDRIDVLRLQLLQEAAVLGDQIAIVNLPSLAHFRYRYNRLGNNRLGILPEQKYCPFGGQRSSSPRNSVVRTEIASAPLTRALSMIHSF